MTHGEFAQAVMKEWNVKPMELIQTCCYQWYHYLTRVKRTHKVIGKYTLVNSKPTFVLIKKDGSEKNFEVTK